METVVIVIHLMVIVALIAVVLLQRSEGGALGIGGGNSFMTARGQGNMLTRVTTILGVVFFGTSIAMSILARLNAPPSAILDVGEGEVITAPVEAGSDAAATGTDGDGRGILDQLEAFTGEEVGGSTPAPEPAPPVSE